MTSRTYQVAIGQLLRQAREELTAGDVRQASEKGWGGRADTESHRGAPRLGTPGPWEEESATDAQLGYLRSLLRREGLFLADVDAAYMTKGMASHMIELLAEDAS